MTEDLDPLPSLLPGEGEAPPARVRDLVRLVATTNRVDVTGARGAAGAYVLAEIARALGRRIVAIAPDVDGAARLAADLAFFLGVDEERGGVLLLSTSESSPYADTSPDRRGAMARLGTLSRLSRGSPWRALVLSAPGLLRRVIPRDELTRASRRVEAESELDRDALLRDLSESGYIRAPVVEDPGSFSVRGSLIDVWPPDAPLPVRIETYGDLVTSVRAFDPDEQRTLPAGSAREVWLPPAREALLGRDHVARARAKIAELADRIDWPTMKTRGLAEDVSAGRAFFGADGYLPAYYERLSAISEYLPDDAIVAIEDPEAVASAAEGELGRAAEGARERAGRPFFEVAELYASEGEAAESLARHKLVTLRGAAILGDAGGGPLAALARVVAPQPLGALDNDDLARATKAARASKGKTHPIAPLARRIAHFRDHGVRVVITARAETQAERLAQLLQHRGVEAEIHAGAFSAELAAGGAGATIVTGGLARGAVLPAEGLAFVTEEEVFGARAHRKRERAGKDAARAFVEDLRSLAVGDFVVHSEHGIGRYRGLIHKDVSGIKVDLLVIEYAAGDKLYLPVYRLSQIEKYAGGEADPKVDRLGGATFAKTKAKVARDVRKMADELLRLYAERQAVQRPPLPAIDDDYRAFEATFPFDETADQAKAIGDVCGDLENARPMDRLVCGDVGFGKTEVALRAAFRVAQEGRQVAVLCPTTVLAQQHFRVFEARMAGYPIEIRALSRFQTKSAQDNTLARLKDGTVDVVVGTHRLLSKDIHFKNLGLLVVDEEQRFGVSHKERIKQLRAHVDVLTLSATPIPRTLQMAVTGIRDLSLITTPPVDRRAVRTIVTRWDDALIREAVERELQRGGQVFFVYNRVEGLYERAQRLQTLVPQARIAVAHGQMAKGSAGQEETNLERTMLDFVDGRYDVLAATAIVESGLDIPRANTIIIDRADMFGLAQLYQLRGRVGRSKERAYCYLVVPPAEAMSDDARARVDALERHTELGSGFKVASLDMELRGAGDLLGAEQSGNVASVGFELFCRMLEDAVHELRGETVVHDIEPELSFDVPALLPEDYVGDVGVRLSVYKRLAGAIDEGHVQEIAQEMEDRFGPPPAEAKALVRMMSLKTELRRLRVLGCEATAKSVTLHLRDDTPLDVAKVLELVRGAKSPYKLTPDMRLTRRFEGADPAATGLSRAETLLADLAKCARP
jgi:transcription-repair coupling factor (superfamily II helicase)